MTLGLASPQGRLRGFVHERQWGVRRAKQTGEVAASASPFALHGNKPGVSTRDGRWKLPPRAGAQGLATEPPAGQQQEASVPTAADDALLLSIWHRGTSTERLGASARRETMDTALVVHDRDFSMFKPAGDASYCSSIHGPHCPQLRDRFAEDAQLADLIDLVAGQNEMEWWSSGSKDRNAAFDKLVEVANDDGRAQVQTSAAVQRARAAMLQRGRERQRSNIVWPDQPIKQTVDDVAEAAANQERWGGRAQRLTATGDTSLEDRKVRNSEARDVAAGDIAPAISGTVPSAVAVAQQ
jgi:hypothetical protein